MPARTATLQSIQVEETADQLVITLTADGPISGRLQQISGGSTRLYIDLHGTRPKVDPVTPVNRGPVLRVRVGLNSAQPPVTRVVLDVSNTPPARVERGDSERQLRIVVGGAAAAAPQASLPASLEAPASSAGTASQEKAWCTELADRVAVLLEGELPSTSQAAMMAAMVAWEDLERDVAARTLAPALQPIHFTLLQALRLGRIAATHRQAREVEQATAAHAGARLLLNTARDRLAALP